WSDFAHELQLLLPLQHVGRDRPRSPTARAHDLAPGRRGHDRGERAPDPTEGAEDSLERSVDDCPQEAPQAVADLPRRALVRVVPGDSHTTLTEEHQREQYHDNLFHLTVLQS